MRYIIVLAVVLVVGCKSKALFYEGYVYDNENPVEYVTVAKENKAEEYTATDANGYFKLSKDPNTLHSLIFTKNGYKIDTVRTVGSQHGERVQYTFLNKEPDTLRLKKLKGSK